MPLFITFEGGDGSGKTTQINLLNEALKDRGHETVVTREPGGTTVGEEVRKILLNPHHQKLSPLSEILLYAASRSQHLEEVIRPALQANKIVLCDRFADATLAYQGYGRGYPLDQISKINDLVLAKTRPDVTFLFDCNPKVGLGRVGKRAQGKPDRFEREPVEFHQKIREGYLQIAKEDSKRILVIDASKNVQTVHQEVLGRVLKML